MEKFSIANLKQLSRNEMKKIMAGSGGTCGSNCDQACVIHCSSGTYGGKCVTSGAGNCFCAGAC